jgi:hypothetical protein
MAPASTATVFAFSSSAVKVGDDQHAVKAAAGNNGKKEIEVICFGGTVLVIGRFFS